MKNASTRIPNSWYQRTPFGKLKAIPAFGLLNMIVLTAEADRLTNGEFELEVSVCCCIGPKPLLDRLWLQPSPDILPKWVALLARFLGWDDDAFVVPHPVLEPAGRAVAVGSANQREWLHHQQEKFVTQAGMELVGFRKRPGSIPVAEYRPRAADGDEHPKDSAGEAT